MKITHKKDGFTLIELLIVISIISLLSSVILSSISSVRAKSRDAVRLQGLNSVRNALNFYASNNGGSFPLGTFFTSHYNTGDAFDWNILKSALSSYIPTIPLDPLNNTTFWWMYTDYFIAAHISSGVGDPAASGTCYGKAIIMIKSSETGVVRQECQFNDVTGNNLKTLYSNAIILLLN